MKQSELNKLLNEALKQAAKAHGWKCSRGFVFKATETLFFSAIILAQAKQRRLYCTLGFKLLAFDDLFWKIVKLEDNAAQPLSFRASGAWTCPTTKILASEREVADWNSDAMQCAVEEMIASCGRDAEGISREIHDPDSNLGVIERYYRLLKEEHPDAVTTIWSERVLTLILKKDYRAAEALVRDRQAQHDSGGFLVGTKSFYDLALEHLQNFL